MGREQDFAGRLRSWRQRRGWSQLDFSGRAGISQRHLSFLELGRASPSRDMVLRLAAALDVPLREHNALLVAAGFAPVWRETELGAPELAQVRDALDYILAQQEPFPAAVVDRRWNLLRANSGAVRLVEFLVGPLGAGAEINLADALVAPDILRPYLVNWADVVRYFILSVEADAAADGTAETAALLARLLRTTACNPSSNRRVMRLRLRRCCRCISARAIFPCRCSRRSRRLERRRTSRCKNCASNASSQ